MAYRDSDSKVDEKIVKHVAHVSTARSECYSGELQTIQEEQEQQSILLSLWKAGQILLSWK